MINHPENFPPPLAGEPMSSGSRDFPRGQGQGGGQGGGYYDYPVVKRPVWTWEIPPYFWLGGMAAGAYLTASLAQRLGSGDDRRYAADGFYLAAAATVPCAPLLVADLGRPERFHHMLRIFKPLSPMNLGAWALTAFSALSVARAIAHSAETGLLRGGLGALARLIPKALVELTGTISGLVLAGYSGVLLASTNVPLWAKSKLLGGVFMASAMSSGSAAVTLAAARRGAPDTTLHRLGTLESAASLGEAAVLSGYLMQSGKTGRHLTSGRFGPPFWLGAVGTGTLLPLLLHRMAGRRSGGALRSLSTVAALCTIAGSLVLRWTIFEAGKVSAEDQSASFELSSQ
jgi:formate-dependent nitrite reductase membrane component NrfD